MKKLPDKTPIPLSKQFPGATVEALEVLREMVQVHPQKRLTVDQALKHTFFATLHDPNDEATSSRPFDFSFENEKLHRVRLQQLIWEEIMDFRQCPLAPLRREGSTP